MVFTFSSFFSNSLFMIECNRLSSCPSDYYKHRQAFHGPLFGTTRVGWYQKKHSPTHTHPDHQTSFINFLHLLRSVASCLFSFCPRQAFSATYLQVLFGLPLGLELSTSYSIYYQITSRGQMCRIVE